MLLSDHICNESVHATDESSAVLFCSAYESSMEALQQPSIRVIAVIAEGVPEGDTKQLIAYAAKHNKIVLGPATVGGLQVQLSYSLPPCDHGYHVILVTM